MDDLFATNALLKLSEALRDFVMYVEYVKQLERMGTATPGQLQNLEVNRLLFETKVDSAMRSLDAVNGVSASGGLGSAASGSSGSTSTGSSSETASSTSSSGPVSPNAADAVERTVLYCLNKV